jgi:hypothetical protein
MENGEKIRVYIMMIAGVFMTKLTTRVIFPAVAGVLLAAGCAYDDGKEHQESDTALMKATNPAPIELKKRKESKSIAYQVREDALKYDQIYDVAVVEGEKQIIVAYKVKHLHRFNMKNIEKKITETLNKKYPQERFVVSSDYKIFLEAVRLKEDLDNGKVSKKEAEKRLKKIIKLKNEMT